MKTSKLTLKNFHNRLDCSAYSFEKVIAPQ